MRERSSRMGETSARAIRKQAAAIYEATGQRIADRRLPVACCILNESLPWESLETEGKPGESPPPVQTKNPEEIKQREENFRRERYRRYRASSY
ncbi:MAG TPA: hypothetical protein VMW04_01400 [Patescibacteria group bacterium]|nr:hypothetical protein [Patescibacteria group bacterium]